MDSALLWHGLLEQHHKKRIEKLQHDGLLIQLTLAFRKMRSYIFRYLKDHGIIAHYVLLLTLHRHTGVSAKEKQNPTRYVRIYDESNNSSKSIWIMLFDSAAQAHLQYGFQLRSLKDTNERWHVGKSPKCLLKILGCEALVKARYSYQADKLRTQEYSKTGNESSTQWTHSQDEDHYARRRALMRSIKRLSERRSQQPTQRGSFFICCTSLLLDRSTLDLLYLHHFFPLSEGRRTAHSRFAIPINVVDDSMYHILADSDLAELIRMSKLIIWDEAPMTLEDIVVKLVRLGTQ
ncbi:ATP-dependent DNA helicase PIF1-like protein [Tanacetum coccineum]